ncbi:MAG: ABC-type sugar transport system ATPase subunit, partial [Acidimicrobiales bacterium]
MSDATNERLLDIKNLSSGYSGVPVVRGVNIHINPGEVV